MSHAAAPQPLPCLSPAACRVRQDRLRAVLAARDLPAAVLSDRKHVYYLTGYWHTHPMAGLILVVPREGDAVLICTNSTARPGVVGTVIGVPPATFCTTNDYPDHDQCAALLPHLKGLKRVGVDLGLLPAAAAVVTQVDLMPDLYRLRRAKDADELVVIRHAIAGAEATYPAARAVLRPGVTELEVYAAMYEAAVLAIGEPITLFGNDFQAGTAGGPPRRRPVESGELMPLDISVGYRGYWSDMSRTFSIDGQTTPAQRQAQAKLVDALAYVESVLKPGKSCKALFHEVHAMLDGHNGWTFNHHLGHGFGLKGHEAPRLNPHFDDTFMVGDVITAEPGLYGPDLRGGIRLEQNYLITATGCERLTHYPLDL